MVYLPVYCGQSLVLKMCVGLGEVLASKEPLYCDGKFATCFAKEAQHRHDHQTTATAGKEPRRGCSCGHMMT